MKRRLTATLLSAACAVLPLGFAPIATTANAQSVMQPSEDIAISIGRGHLVTVPGSMADIFIANEGVADVQLKSQNQLYIFGRSGGQTTIYASNAAGDVIWAANIVVGSNIDSIDQMLALAMPDAKVSVATMGPDTVLLTGTVAAPEDAAEAERLVQAFLGEGALVVSRMKTATPLQVNLQVRFAEVSRSLVRDIGNSIETVDWSTGGFRGGIGTGRSIGTGTYDTQGPIAVGNGVQNPQLQLIDPNTGQVIETITGPGVNVAGSGSTIGYGIAEFLGLDILGALDLGETMGLVTTLSQPNLTALSGETAEFLAGGEFPIPLSQGLGTTSINYKKFGVSLAYSPTVLSNGRISLRVRPEVSELSSQGAVNINGFTVPALTVRRAETTVELGSGQSFMIAGLMSNNAQSSISKTPGLGDVPILGNLFKSQGFRKGQTELVIVVTPYLVKPVNASDIALPTDGFEAASLAEQLFLNRENSGRTGGTRPMPRAADQSAPPPQVSNVHTSDASQQAQVADARNRREDEVTERTADAAAPGFSIN